MRPGEQIASLCGSSGSHFGSLAEIETQLLLAVQLGYIQDSTPLLQTVEDTRRMLLGLIRHLENKS